MLGTIMFLGDLLMEALPNIHFVGALCVTYAVVFRFKALIPIYVYVILNGFYLGFSAWWLPYVYIWLPLWGVAMLIPRRLNPKIRCVIYPIITALHGFLFGILYAPAQALFFNLNFNETILWISSGAVFDAIHGVSNFFVGFLIIPFSELLNIKTGLAAMPQA